MKGDCHTPYTVSSCTYFLSGLIRSASFLAFNSRAPFFFSFSQSPFDWRLLEKLCVVFENIMNLCTCYLLWIFSCKALKNEGEKKCSAAVSACWANTMCRQQQIDRRQSFNRSLCNPTTCRTGLSLISFARCFSSPQQCRWLVLQYCAGCWLSDSLFFFSCCHFRFQSCKRAFKSVLLALWGATLRCLRTEALHCCKDKCYRAGLEC